MDPVNSSNPYGKVDPTAAERDFRYKRLKSLIIIAVSLVILLALIALIVGTVLPKSSPSPDVVPLPKVSPATSLTAVCSQTLYPNSCYSSISLVDSSNTTDPQKLFEFSLQVAIDGLSYLKQYPAQLKAKTNETLLGDALDVCELVFDDAFDRLNDSLSLMEVGAIEKILLTDSKIDDLRTWLSASGTDQETCMDTLREVNPSAIRDTTIEQLQKAMQNSSEFTSNSLAIATKVLSLLTGFNIPIHRKLLSFPDWVTPSDRQFLLQEDKKNINTTTNVTVAADGSGDYKTIGEAIAQVPKKSVERFVIHVKEGVYKENVNLDKNKWNVMIIGDGKTKTIISGSLNHVDGIKTFRTATLVPMLHVNSLEQNNNLTAVTGKGFIAKDIGFINTAGPEKEQAVAMRSDSDKSVFYRCSFDAYQDTLYTYSNRQFYRECDITGTVDFIFGNAAVVFQNCNIIPRQPLAGQSITITAQGKNESNQNTGISIQNCTFSTGGANLTAPIYLGRPWRNFSTSVVMQSEIGLPLDPLGWKEFVENREPPKTIFYAEYRNTGTGADTSKRVTWTGYKPEMTTDEAAKYTVKEFVRGSEWLPELGVPYQQSL
ncbi:hypothetical protein ACFE04_003805 [Oxalis oulophora]